MARECKLLLLTPRCCSLFLSRCGICHDTNHDGVLFESWSTCLHSSRGPRRRLWSAAARPNSGDATTSVSANPAVTIISHFSSSSSSSSGFVGGSFVGSGKEGLEVPRHLLVVVSEALLFSQLWGGGSSTPPNKWSMPSTWPCERASKSRASFHSGAAAAGRVPRRTHMSWLCRYTRTHILRSEVSAVIRVTSARSRLATRCQASFLPEPCFLSQTGNVVNGSIRSQM
mmetsp:Transcript_7679/g.14482  ORF Transcript_7679/g.14482 Transcript_7679/m.14482 type:complete len:228 (+) Transcript_7679:885-1568(+)